MVKIDFRCSEIEKENYKFKAKKNQLSLSEFIRKTLNNNSEIDDVLEGEKRISVLLDKSLESCFEPFFKNIKTKLNRISIDINTVIEQNNILYKQLDLPQEKENILVPVFNHPITDIAKEIVIKSIRKNRTKKN